MRQKAMHGIRVLSERTLFLCLFQQNADNFIKVFILAGSYG